MLYFAGGAGNGNFGDELIVKGWLEYLSRKGYSGKAIFDENYADISTGFFGKGLRGVAFAQDLSMLKRRGPKDFHGSVLRGLKFFDNGGFSRHPDMGHLEETFRRVKVFHLHGGGYINSLWPTNAFYLGFGAAVKRRYGCRVVGTGLGVLPAAALSEEKRQVLEEALDAFDVLELRDRWSYDYLRSASASPAIIYGLDDTYLIEANDAPGRRNRRTLHISLFASAKKIESFARLLESDAPKDFDRLLFWACTNQDKSCFKTLVQSAPRLELADWQTLVKGPLPVAPGDFMVTTRFHPHLLAARHGACGLFRKDKGYYDVKHGSVVDLGSPFRPMGDEIEMFEPPRGVNAIRAFDRMRVAMKRRLADEIYADIL